MTADQISCWLSPVVAIVVIVLACPPCVSPERDTTIDASVVWFPSKEDAMIDKQLTFTCRGKCGQEVNLPCSCKASCLVYATCCENMTQDCPDILTEGRKKLFPYIGAEIVCTASKVFKIASCPYGDVQNETEAPHVDVEAEIAEKIRNGSSDLSPEDLERAAINAPVTDTETMFTFLNRFIYNCYKDAGFASYNSLLWSVLLKYKGTSLSEFGQMNNVYRVSPYLATFDYSVLRDLHRCPGNIISSCDGARNSAGLTPSVRNYFRQKCKEFAAKVFSTKTWELYRNRFCAYCHEGLHDSYELKSNLVPVMNFKLGILVSIKQDGAVQLRSPGVSVGSWSSAVCPNLESVRGTNQTVDKNLLVFDDKDETVTSACQIGSCFQDFTLTSDGLCKSKRYAKIAFSEYPDLDPILCWPALQRVAEFISCGLDLLLDLGAFRYAEFEKATISVSQDLRTQKILYIVDLSFRSSGSLTNNILAFNENEMLPNLHRLAITIKTLQSYRRLHDLCLTAIGQDRVETTHPITTLDLEKHVESFNDTMVKLRGPVVDQNKTLTVCGSKMYLLPDPNILTPQCFEDVVYEQDETDISGLLQSSCTSLLEHGVIPSSLTPIENTAGAHHKGQSVMQGIALVLLMYSFQAALHTFYLNR